MYYIKLFILYIKYLIKAEAQYRANFITGLFANFLTYFLTYMSVWVITNRFDSLNGWNYNDLVFLTALHLFSYGIASTFLWGYIFGLEKKINDGSFDKVLVRPIDPVVSLSLEGFAWTGIGQIVVSSFFLIGSLVAGDIEWSFYKAIVLILSIIGAILIQCSAHLFFGTLSFWMRKSFSLANVLYYTFRYFINYPLTIYGKIVRYTLTFILPWGFINYYPAVFILDKKELHADWYIFTPILGVVLFVLTIGFSKLGIKKYESVGN
ncbi:ABC transporter permease [Paenibacillus lutimineralis]|uniref:ABC transporter permease n=1 Tax=Paenibacillus lutimineralis TaxID=2707005 RepID=A0A3S9V1W2_9BACL|nr:ABC-2 family transporter protein [Paenibacillus lutimineralis]AZS16347.1 hypothetical protein EI981_19110 [Paenibacillus lutimineralis]